jgi:hypothetical protein
MVNFGASQIDFNLTGVDGSHLSKSESDRETVTALYCAVNHRVRDVHVTVFVGAGILFASSPQVG